MDLWHIGVRALFAYVLVLALVRASGHRTVRQGDVASFVLAIVLGDLFDDFFWAEVPAAQFVVAVGALITLHIGVSAANARRRPDGWSNKEAPR